VLKLLYIKYLSGGIVVDEDRGIMNHKDVKTSNRY